MAKILVIDAKPDTLDFLDPALRRKGHEVVLADRGRKGLLLLQREHPNVTILDLKMPDVDGFAVLKQIRILDPHAPVIVLTGLTTEKDVQEARELGVTEILQKGISWHFVGAALDRVLNQMKKTMMGTERRQFPRISVRFPISLVKLQDGGLIGQGTGYDLSTWGCAVESQAKVETGKYLVLQLFLPDQQAQTTPLVIELAAVRWTFQQKVGLEFLSLPKGGLQRLHRYITSLQTGGQGGFTKISV